MRVPLDRHWTQRLLALPESGMGYQRVSLRLRDGRTFDDVVALNAELLELPDAVGQFDAKDIVEMELARAAS